MFEKFHDRCIREKSKEISWKKGKRKSCPGSYLLNYLVDYMCETYDYGFIKSKSCLPKPVVSAVSYLSQLLLNIKCTVKMFCKDGDVSQVIEAIGNPIKSEAKFDKWRFIVEDRPYSSYEELKHATIPFSWISRQYIGNK